MSKKISLLLIVGLLVFSLITVFANSAEPPSVIVLVAVSDAENLTIETTGLKTKPQVIERPYQVQYNFYQYDFKRDEPVVLRVKYGEREFTVSTSVIDGYRNVFSLDLANEQLNREVSPILQATIIGGRIGLTLLLEGIILFVFGFRQRKTWLYFLLINLATQFFLNVSLSRAPIFYSDYFWIGALIYECLILLIEMAAFLLLVEESSKIKQFFYVLISNIISFIVGGYLIMQLPI